jgi:hypothetical protein
MYGLARKMRSGKRMVHGLVNPDSKQEGTSMKRTASLIVSMILLAGFAVLPAFAQRGGGAGAAGGAGRGGGMGGGMASQMGRGPAENPTGPGMERGRPTSGMEHGTQTTMGKQKTPGELLAQNTKLSSKLGTLLPAGTDLQEAAAGFKNLGEFVAATHVSHNLGIPFEDLKAKMTGSDPVSLGKAIKELKPEVDAKAEAKKAKKQASEDLRETEPQS